MNNRTMQRAATIRIVLTAAPMPRTGPNKKKTETPHLSFVTEYVRELAANEAIRASAEKAAHAWKYGQTALQDSGSP